MDEDGTKKKSVKSKETASYIMQKLVEQKNHRLDVSSNTSKIEFHNEDGASRVRKDDEI
jgi:hypothetical protein